MPDTSVNQKKTVSVTVEPMLLQQARDAGLNLSAILSEALRQEVRIAAAKKWKHENSAGLQELNRITEEHGLLSDEYRTF
ncbi:antitoxin [Pantoea sp. BL1]|uniref:type II toxin-antitoxin system CcdA family antitoxin n=1 Tax=Erwiniaceae TaxID=1903409 RepID=UPI0005F887F2|nr:MULTISPECIES: type II toxin-antitoxin system CcdA family antitoxin [Erwiniaceae]HAU5564412.1 antitoxin [Serratia fonticola]KJV28206.1 antitoxin [Pantoea sp. SM3]KJV45537.1 antitoxin [Pantoea sp. BL1]MBK0090131.1 type II toxin-antitoxin system CcdA family antitoxin [Erwinia sp. S59]MBK0125699.1 type II toxin-antitoxin system CcdA family antitoxin [Pantoea sp. S61]